MDLKGIKTSSSMMDEEGNGSSRGSKRPRGDLDYLNQKEKIHLNKISSKTRQ